MDKKHGLSQYRLNYAKDYAKGFFEAVSKIEIMFQLSKEGHISEDLAGNYIKSNIDEIDRNWDYFKSYLEQRVDKK